MEGKKVYFLLQIFHALRTQIYLIMNRFTP